MRVDNRRLLLETSKDLDDGFLGHLAEKYGQGSSKGSMSGIGKHLLISGGQAMSDCELWEVPTLVRRDIQVESQSLNVTTAGT